MEKDYQIFFLNELLQIWKNTTMRPVYGVWLAEIEHSNLQDEPKKEIVLNAWFLKDGNFEKRQVDEYVRFIVVQGDKPWSTRMFGESNPIFKSRTHEIGISKFGIDSEKRSYFFSWQFGGLFGRSEIYKKSEDGKIIHSHTVAIS